MEEVTAISFDDCKAEKEDFLVKEEDEEEAGTSICDDTGTKLMTIGRGIVEEASIVMVGGADNVNDDDDIGSRVGHWTTAVS